MSVFSYDALGHRTSMTRYKDPANKTGAVTTTWHHNSLGWVTKLEEPGVAPQTRTFDSWGKLTQVQWCDDLSAGALPNHGPPHHRPLRCAQPADPSRRSGPAASGARDRQRLHLRRQCRQRSRRFREQHAGPARLGYLGHRPGVVHLRRFRPGQLTLVRRHHGNAQPRTITRSTNSMTTGRRRPCIFIQDTNKEDERSITATTRPAASIRSSIISAASSQTLFSASGAGPIYDAFGRLNNAQYGLAQFQRDLRGHGRRLLTDVKVTSGGRVRIRARSQLPDHDGVNALRSGWPRADAARNSSMRLDTVSDADFLLRSYDALGRLRDARIRSRQLQADRAFSYDRARQYADARPTPARHTRPASRSPIRRRTSTASAASAMNCHAPAAPACNVSYDGAGNTVSMPTRTGSTRTLELFPERGGEGHRRRRLQCELRLRRLWRLAAAHGPHPECRPAGRQYFGRYIKQRIEGSQSVINRRIPLPGVSPRCMGQ